MFVSDLRVGDIFLSPLYGIVLIITRKKTRSGIKLEFLTINSNIVATTVSGALELVPTEIEFIDSGRGAK